MKITLFWPELFHPHQLHQMPSLTIAQLGSYLKCLGYDVDYVITDLMYLDLRKLSEKNSDKLGYFFLRQDIKKIEYSRPDILLISSWFFNLPYILELTKVLKKRNPNIIQILGGYPPTAIPEIILQVSSHLDFLIKGEGEIVLRNLLPILEKYKSINLDHNSGFLKKLISVKGICFTCKGHNFVNKNEENYIALDDLPFPDYTQLFKIKSYKELPLLTSRGCNYNKCYFCTSTKYSPFRTKSVKYLEKELKYYHHNFKDIHTISIVDNNFTYNAQRTERISELLKKHGYFWRCYSRIDISKSIIDSMIQNNCIGIFFGLESVNPFILIRLNKAKNVKIYQKKAKEILSYISTKYPSLKIDVTYIQIPEHVKENKQTEKFLLKFPKFFKHITRIQPIPGCKGYDKWHMDLVKNRVNKTFFNRKYKNKAILVPEEYGYNALKMVKNSLNE